jgi:glutamine synthetase
MAALDGIQNQIDPPEPVDNDIEQMSPEEAGQIERTPTGLSRALSALQADHDYLLQGDVFTTELIRNWIDYKMESEVIPMASRPTPYEFCMYYNV